ncbi:MAG: hypothetical protein AUJ49_08070 [Desulfovibrionaceae bacterium CG1_02_65_16]|nr:MAG: hypothetical protein AUJ49_08070 [Desulfovibrionaceae bacterium CG1_02_65_16]
MGNADWSLDLLERDLAAGFALLGQAERSGSLGPGESQVLADGVLRCMNGALMKVSESLDAQARLRRELTQTREEMARAQASQSVRIQGLEAEIAALRADLEAERRRGAQSLPRATMSDCAEQAPAEAHLTRPLVLRSGQGDFLGVADGQGRALNLAGLLRLVEHSHRVHADRVVATCWERLGSEWCLSVTITGPRPCGYVLATRSQLTPNGNHVTQLAQMRVDGRAVPQEFVARMFRQLRDAFQE